MCATGPPNDVRPSRTQRGTPPPGILLPRRSRLPQRLVRSGKCVGGTRKDEEQVGEAVEIDATSGLIGCRPAATSVSRSARRQTVRATWRPADAAVPPGSTKLLSSGSDSLYASHWPRADRSSPAPHGACLRPRRDREVGTDVEELVLDASERRSKLLRAGARENDAEQRVELVRRTEGGDPGVQLCTREPSPSEVSPASPPRV